MDTINLTQKRVDELNVYNKGGFEGKILLYNETMLLKYFEPYLRDVINFDEKKYKLERFYEKNINKNFLAGPLILANIDGKFGGFMMNKVADAVTIDHIRNLNHLLSLYSKLFTRLDLLHKKGIIIGDLKHENIIVDPNDNPVFVDVDSMGIDEFSHGHKGVLPRGSKTIADISKKMTMNDAKSIDKLLLLNCFVTSLGANNEPNFFKVRNSNLTEKTKLIITRYLSDYEIDYNVDFSHILIEEKEGKTR